MSYAGLYDASDPTDHPNYQPPGTKGQRTCRFTSCKNRGPFYDTRDREDHEVKEHGINRVTEGHRYGWKSEERPCTRVTPPGSTADQEADA